MKHSPGSFTKNQTKTQKTSPAGGCRDSHVVTSANERILTRNPDQNTGYAAWLSNQTDMLCCTVVQQFLWCNSILKNILLLFLKALK